MCGKKSQINDPIAHCEDRLLIIALIVFFPLFEVNYNLKQQQLWLLIKSRATIGYPHADRLGRYFPVEKLSPKWHLDKTASKPGSLK